MVASTGTSKSQSGVDRESSELDCKATSRCVFSSVHLFDVSPSSSSWAHSTDSASKERNPCKQEPTSASRGHFLEPHFFPIFSFRTRRKMAKHSSERKRKSQKMAAENFCPGYSVSGDRWNRCIRPVIFALSRGLFFRRHILLVLRPLRVSF